MVGSSHKATHNASSTIKFLCSYGGRILPRYPDGKLRYHGGETRVLAVDRAVTFPELLLKMGEMCGTSVTLRCQLPKEDLDALVTITSDEDLANLIEEYDRAASMKIRAFLSMPMPMPKSTNKISPPPSLTPSSSSTSPDGASSPKSICYATPGSNSRSHYFHQMPKPIVFPLYYEKSAGMLPYRPHSAYRNYNYGSSAHIYVVHNGDYCH